MGNIRMYMCSMAFTEYNTLCCITRVCLARTAIVTHYSMYIHSAWLYLGYSFHQK